MFFAELKGASGAMNVAKLQNFHNGASAVYNLLRLHQVIGLEDEFYDKAWVLALDTNGEMWRLRCHWVSKGGLERDTYNSKVLRCWAVEDPRDSMISEARASMRNIVDWIRDVLFKDLSAAVDTYENRPELEDASISLASDHSFVDETQSVGFGTRINPTLSSQEVPETDHESIHESIESAHVDTSITTQGSSLSNAQNEKKKSGLASERRAFFDSAAPS